MVHILGGGECKGWNALLGTNVLIVQEKRDHRDNNDAICNTRRHSSVSAIRRRIRHRKYQGKRRRKEGDRPLGDGDGDDVEEKGKDHHGNATVDAVRQQSADHKEGVLQVREDLRLPFYFSPIPT